MIKKYIIIGIILLLMGTNIPSSGVTIQPIPIKYHQLMIFNVFVIGKVKDPYWTDDRWGFNFQVINITIIGLFWVDLGVSYFGIYTLNESWFGKDTKYWGVNKFRIMFNPSETVFICGILSSGDLLGP